MQNPSSPGQVPPRYNWSEVWTAVLTRPSVQTFTELLDDPQAKPRRAYIWVYLTAVLVVVMLGFSLINNPAISELLASAAVEAGLDSSVSLTQTLFVSLLCTAPISAALVLVFFILFSSFVQFVATQITSAEQTAGRFQPLVYALACVIAPVNLIGLLLIIVPILGILSIPLSIYQVVLMVQAVRAVYGFEMQQALTATLIPTAVFFLLVVVFTGGL